MSDKTPLDPSNSGGAGGDGPLCMSGILKKRECPYVFEITSGWRTAHASLSARTTDYSARL